MSQTKAQEVKENLVKLKLELAWEEQKKEELERELEKAKQALERNLNSMTEQEKTDLIADLVGKIMKEKGVNGCIILLMGNLKSK